MAPDGTLLGWRRIDLTRDLPTHPYHHEGSRAIGRYLNSKWTRPFSLADAVALMERVHIAATLGPRDGLGDLAAALPLPIASIAIRVCPTLPPTIEERITDTRAATMADSVMYRQALATAADARGRTLHWYDRDQVFRDLTAMLGCENINASLSALGRWVGKPWQAIHKLAAAAAMKRP